MRKNIALGVILFSFFLTSCDKSRPISSATYTFYGEKHTKKAPSDFIDLPVIIQDSANIYLKNWLGPKLFKDFHYYGGRIIDRELMSAEMKADTTIPDYVLHYSYINEYEDYTAALLMSSKGKIITELDFPNVSKYPEKEFIISSEQAIDELTKNRKIKGKVLHSNLLYKKEIGSFVWVLDIVARDSNVNHKYGIVVIDAHSGKIIEDRDGFYYSY